MKQLQYNIRISFFVGRRPEYLPTIAILTVILDVKLEENTPVNEKSEFVARNRIVLKIKKLNEQRSEVKNKNNKNRFSLLPRPSKNCLERRIRIHTNAYYILFETH